MEKNAWKVCDDICSRIDGEPGPHGDMTAYVTARKGIKISHIVFKVDLHDTTCRIRFSI